LSERVLSEAAVEVLIARLPHAEGLPLPSPATPGSAGYDLASAEDGELAPLQRKLFRTGFSIAVPAGYECQLRPRSGLAFRHGITLPNTPATIDSDYRGELMVALVNLGSDVFQVTRGMRIAQMVVARVERVLFHPVEELPPTSRGPGGFGSSGT
jgi:dUTP pyrophosphatase